MSSEVAKTYLSCSSLILAIATFACSGESPKSTSAPWTPPNSETQLYETRIVSPPAAGSLKTAAREVNGEPVSIACITCHGSNAEASDSFAARALAAKTKSDSRVVHSELEINHGELSCSSCHDTANPSLLRSADGQRFALTESMRLCSQCHGLIRKAYDNGAHGGMRGYWDLQRGPRERNTCISCHNPHSPAHPQIIPVAGPKDKRVFRTEHKGSLIDQRFGKEQNE